MISDSMTSKQQHRALSLFMVEMRDVFEENLVRGKPGWRGQDPSALLERVCEELREVQDEFALFGTEGYSLENLVRECADVANMVGIFADRMKEESVRV